MLTVNSDKQDFDLLMSTFGLCKYIGGSFSLPYVSD